MIGCVPSNLCSLWFFSIHFSYLQIQHSLLFTLHGTTSLLFFTEEIEIIRGERPGKPSPDLLMSHVCRSYLPLPQWHMEMSLFLLQAGTSTWNLASSSCLQVRYSSNFFLIFYNNIQHTFPVKSQIVSILGFMGLMCSKETLFIKVGRHLIRLATIAYPFLSLINSPDWLEFTPQ